MDTATTEIYTLSLHDALPIYRRDDRADRRDPGPSARGGRGRLADLRGIFGLMPLSGFHPAITRDRKSTRLNSSHLGISYAVFCLKKKKKKINHKTHKMI